MLVYLIRHDTMALVTFLAFSMLVFLDLVLAQVIQNDDGGGTINFSTPSLNDEDHHSSHLPADLRCDGCRAVAYQLSSKLQKAHEKRPSLKRLPESQVLEIFDSTCESKFHYGLKNVKGVRRLSGPGLETDKVPGVTQGGGKWPARLSEMCAIFVGEVGEEELYEAYLENPVLEEYLCYGEGILGDCVTKSKGTEKKQEL